MIEIEIKSSEDADLLCSILSRSGYFVKKEERLNDIKSFVGSYEYYVLVLSEDDLNGEYINRCSLKGF